MQKATIPGVATGTSLGAGAVVSGRFQIERQSTMLGQLVIYDAKDQRTQRAIALWAIPPGIIRPDVVIATRGAIKSASAIANKDLVVPFGSSTDPVGTLFVATEPLGATSLADRIEQKRKQGGAHSIAEAFRFLEHAMNGLTAAHATMSHGAISPSLFRFESDGRVKLAGLGLVAPLVASRVVQAEFLAPEVRKGLTPTKKSDVYSLGAVLYLLCTGKPADPNVAPSEALPGLATAFDIVMEQCLAESPNDRFETVEQLKKALSSLSAPTMAPSSAHVPASDGFDVPVEFDVEMDSVPAKPMGHAPPPPRPAPPSATPRWSPPGMPAIGARVALGPDISQGATPSGLNNVDLKGLLDEATTNDAPRWMFVRGGLDHGPLSARELIQAIIRNEVTEDDVVFNMDSGERKKLTEWAQYREFAQQTRDKRRKDQHAREVKSAIADESVSTKAKAAVAIAMMAMVAVIGLAYYKTLGPGRSLEKRTAELDDALAQGHLHLSQGGLQVLPAPPPSAGGGGHRSGGGGGGGGFAGSYESAMNQPIDMNFTGAGPSGGTLSDREISAPLNATLQRFGSCATAEMARGGNVHQVQMRIAVGGSGSPIGLTVQTGSGAFKSCVGGIVRGLHWRAFGGPRIGFAWGFSLD